MQNRTYNNTMIGNISRAALSKNRNPGKKSSVFGYTILYIDVAHRDVTPSRRDITENILPEYLIS